MVSVVGTPHCLKEGMDFIFMILNYIYLAIWGARAQQTMPQENVVWLQLVRIGEVVPFFFFLTVI